MCIDSMTTIFTMWVGTVQPTRPLGWARILCLTDRVKITVKDPIQNVFCFYPTNTKQILNHLKTASRAASDLSPTIAMSAQCCMIRHCMIGRESDPVWPAWLNQLIWSWVPVSGIQFSSSPKTHTHEQVWGNTLGCALFVWFWWMVWSSFPL